MNEINGFEIDVFNQFELPTGCSSHTCPLCSGDRKKKTEKCLSVFWETGSASCNHCGEFIQLHTYKKKVAEKDYKKPVFDPTRLDLSDKLLNYMEARSISKMALKRLKIGNGLEWMPQTKKEERCIHFNYYLGDELINTKFRDGKKNFKMFKDGRKALYNIDSLRYSTSAIITEGEMDVLSFVTAGLNYAVSVPNGATISESELNEYKKTGSISNPNPLNLAYLDESYEHIKHIEKWYICVDEDGAGWKLKKELIRRFGPENCYLVDFKDCKDANEYLVKYGAESLKNVIDESKPIPLEGVVTINDTWEDLTKFWQNGAEKGSLLGLREMDKYCSFVPQQYTLLLSAPGAGKSDKIDDIVCRLALRYGDKTAFASVENQPFHLHQNKWFRRLLGKTPSLNETNSAPVLRVKEFIGNHFIHVHPADRYELTDVLKKFGELVKRKGIRYFVIDPFNKIHLKGIDRGKTVQYTEEYHMLLDEFVKKYDCHLFLVLHPTKLSYEEGTKTYVMPTAYNAKGGGEHFDMSYNIIGMTRDIERRAVRFRTLKWKYQHLGSSDKEWFEMWNTNNGRYTDICGDYSINDIEIPLCTWDYSDWLNGADSKDAKDEQATDTEVGDNPPQINDQVMPQNNEEDFINTENCDVMDGFKPPASMNAKKEFNPKDLENPDGSMF